MKILHWHARMLPHIRNCGLYFHPGDDFSIVYCSPTHCLHQYLYATTVRIGNTTHAVRPGDVTLTPAGTKSSYRHEIAGRHWCVHFHPDKDRTRSTKDMQLSIPQVLHAGAAAHHITALLRQTIQFFNTPAAGEAGGAQHETLAALRCLECLHVVAQQNMNASPPATRERTLPHAMEELLQYLEQHIDTQESVEALAARVGLSQNYLARQFRRTYQMTIQQYLLQRRIDHARHLLSTTSLPIQQIGSQVGIPDAQYFNKLFRRMCGESPSAYRRRFRA